MYTTLLEPCSRIQTSCSFAVKVKSLLSNHTELLMDRGQRGRGGQVRLCPMKQFSTREEGEKQLFHQLQQHPPRQAGSPWHMKAIKSIKEPEPQEVNWYSRGMQLDIYFCHQ